MQAEQVKRVKSVVNIRRDGEIRKFHQQIILLIQRVPRFVDLNIRKIFVAQMKVASGGKFQLVANPGLKFISELEYQFGTELVFRVRVRRRDDVRNAVCNGDFRHLDGNFHGLRAVVNTGKNVAMDINH